MKKLSSFLILSLLALSVSAQQENLSNSTKPIQLSEPPMDGYVLKTDIENRKVVPYANIRQTDIAYSKRVWRELDLREKMNANFGSPKSRLIDIIIDAVMAGELTAYDPTPSKDDPNGDSFKTILPINQVMARFGGDSVLVEKFDENGDVISSGYEARVFSGEDVLKFRIKEDWIFDKQRSVFEPRIVGIAPLITPRIPGLESAGFPNPGSGNADIDPFDPFAVRDDADNAVPQQMPNPAVADPFAGQADPVPAFWIYFPEARHIFVNKEVASRHNDATGLSYDDIFIRRMFSSYIVKQSNPEDLRIKDYMQDGLERLYESERIKKSLMDYEQDLWSY